MARLPGGVYLGGPGISADQVHLQVRVTIHARVNTRSQRGFGSKSGAVASYAQLIIQHWRGVSVCLASFVGWLSAQDGRGLLFLVAMLPCRGLLAAEAALDMHLYTSPCLVHRLTITDNICWPGHECCVHMCGHHNVQAK
jgi:hypothetical protein